MRQPRERVRGDGIAWGRQSRHAVMERSPWPGSDTRRSLYMFKSAPGGTHPDWARGARDHGRASGKRDLEYLTTLTDRRQVDRVGAAVALSSTGWNCITLSLCSIDDQFELFEHVSYIKNYVCWRELVGEKAKEQMMACILGCSG